MQALNTVIPFKSNFRAKNTKDTVKVSNLKKQLLMVAVTTYKIPVIDL